jgi:hypothetical protein
VLGSAVGISSLDIDKRYPVIHADRLETKYVTSVLLTICDSTNNVIEVFLPHRYRVVFTDNDITSINGITVQYHMTYKGRCFKSNSYILQIDS